MMHSWGKLYGIGAGPGDPELITVKGLRLLQQVPVVAFPAGVGGKLGMAHQIVSPWLRSAQVQLPLVFPFVQDEAVLSQAWRSAAEQVWHYLKQGQDVAFVSEGDVSFYSTFTYLAQTLLEIDTQIEIETIPGICSPMAAAAALGIPLTIRAQRLVILPALYSMAVLESALTSADVVVLMKVSSVYQQVWSILQQYQLLRHSYVVVRATLPDQLIYADLSDRSNLQLPYFSLLIVQSYSPLNQ
ncbi:precorrin-2 C(20)-methyltransferase [Thermocoleostomius sinensis]|uniref:Precorrin-2 C(20)-methyltransferase n=1 Tax=Thermocoleostomius sinensis A174 TaxID=2016057 RepID=A0A9E9C6Z8_9CYAN|nr:precorrin-2 C(20)-methyltransferase [Thermocoleostomius sinensis]WAL59809.1 precorrin-2 C(20)-methyltransferase [Thermocoleostomius sinensis A174]